MTVKVLMVAPRYYPYLGGFERQAHTLSKRLVQLGVDVSVVTGRHDATLPVYEEQDGVKIHRLPSADTALGRGLTFTPSLAKFLIVNRHRYDVLHVHTFGWYLLGVMPLAKMFCLPVLLKLPNVGESGLPGLRARKGGSLLLRLVKAASAFVAMSEESVDELHAEGIENSHILLNTNGVDTTVFNPLQSDIEKNALRKRLSLPNGKIVLFTGRLTAQKGLIDLLSIWPYILKEAPSSHLVLCGSGEQEYELRQLIRCTDAEQTVHFVGDVGSPVDYYRASDLLAHPSYVEGNSNSILEAMACGLPLVSTIAGGTPMLVGRAGREYLVTPGDRQALADAILTLLESNDKAKRLSAALVERTHNALSIDVVARHYHECYKLLAAEEYDKVGGLSNRLTY